MRQGALPRIILAVYLVVLMLPIYWLINMSLRTNSDIMSGMALWPHHPTLEKYFQIFSDPTWVHGFGVSLTYVAINTVISVAVALPAAYAFNRYAFVGDKHLFFWLLTNLMAPTAVFAMPFFNLYYAVGLFDTVWAVALAHCLFNIPLAVWILEGFVGGVPREIDETAAIDGYSFPRFFIRIFMPLIANGIGVTAFFCFMFSWVEQLLATTLTATNALPFAAVMTRSYSVSGMDWSLLAAAGVSDDDSRRGRDLVRPQSHRQGLRPWPRLEERRDARVDGVDLADGAVLLPRGAGAHHSDAACDLSAGNAARRHPALSDHARRPVLRHPDRLGFHFRFLAAAWRGRLWYPLAASVVYGIAMFRFA